MYFWKVGGGSGCHSSDRIPCQTGGVGFRRLLMIRIRVTCVSYMHTMSYHTWVDVVTLCGDDVSHRCSVHLAIAPAMSQHVPILFNRVEDMLRCCPLDLQIVATGQTHMPYMICNWSFATDPMRHTGHAHIMDGWALPSSCAYLTTPHTSWTSNESPSPRSYIIAHDTCTT